MTAPPAAGLSAAGYPKGGRPPKVRNAHRWHLIVNRVSRDAAADRAARQGHGDVTDVLRSLLDAYAAGKLDAYATPTPKESR